MKNQEITPTATLFDKILDAIGWISFCLLFAVPFYYLVAHPEIPWHFGKGENPEWIHGKGVIWPLVILAAGIWLFSRWIIKVGPNYRMKSPWYRNHPFGKEHSELVESIGRPTFTLLVLFFLNTIYSSIERSMGNTGPSESSVGSILLFAYIGIHVIYIYHFWRLSKKKEELIEG